MDINFYQIIFMPVAMREISSIYNYITYELQAEIAAKRLLQLFEIEISKLKYSPRMYRMIEKYDEVKRKYRRIIVRNYVILYTIDEENRIVYISHIYYGKSNYLKGY